MSAWERYLAEGEMDEARRREVQGALEVQRRRVGLLSVRANVPGTLTIDGVDRGAVPMAEPLALTIGSYVVGVRAAGYDHPTREVEIAGGATAEVELTLSREERGSLRVRSVPDGVEVEIDGSLIGTTPLSSTIAVAAGTHVVIGRRAGYREHRVEAEVAADAEREVVLDLQRDPTSDELARLELRVPDARGEMWLDADELESTTSDVPIGEHVLRIELEERIPLEQAIEIPREGLSLTPTFQWTDEARQRRLNEARRRRRTGWSLVGVGAALIVGATGVLVWNGDRQKELDEFQPGLDCLDMTGMDCSHLIDSADVPYARDLERSVPATRTGMGMAIGAGLLLGASGFVIALRAPDEDEIDRSASARLRLGLRPQLEVSF